VDKGSVLTLGGILWSLTTPVPLGDLQRSSTSRKLSLASRPPSMILIMMSALSHGSRLRSLRGGKAGTERDDRRLQEIGQDRDGGREGKSTEGMAITGRKE